MPSNLVAEGQSDDDLVRLARALRLYCCGAGRLVALYLAARHRHQRHLAPGEFPCGSITLRALVLPQSGTLRVEVLNARLLKPVEVLLARSGQEGTSDLRLISQQQQQPHMDSMTTCCSSSSSSAYSSAQSGFSTNSSSVSTTLNGSQRRVPPKPKPRQKLLLKQQQQQQAQQSQISRILQADQKATSLALSSPSATLMQEVGLSPPPSASASTSGGAAAGLDSLRLKLDGMRLRAQGAHLAVHRNLKQEGQCDPYVVVRIVPEEAGALGGAKAKTRTQRRTLFPL